MQQHQQDRLCQQPPPPPPHPVHPFLKIPFLKIVKNLFIDIIMHSLPFGHRIMSYIATLEEKANWNRKENTHLETQGRPLMFKTAACIYH